jgi:hypothetical protein
VVGRLVLDQVTVVRFHLALLFVSCPCLAVDASLFAAAATVPTTVQCAPVGGVLDQGSSDPLSSSALHAYNTEQGSAKMARTPAPRSDEEAGWRYTLESAGNLIVNKLRWIPLTTYAA